MQRWTCGKARGGPVPCLARGPQTTRAQQPPCMAAAQFGLLRAGWRTGRGIPGHWEPASPDLLHPKPLNVQSLPGLVRNPQKPPPILAKLQGCLSVDLVRVLSWAFCPRASDVSSAILAPAQTLWVWNQNPKPQ